ncbi:MAG: BlaI/MecI/CopY family transcriptional regulator [Actinobacteria bacterium]|nr:BlaI/MecI/CopY family transcriptional regulator [Actinomycetota bacterium]
MKRFKLSSFRPAESGIRKALGDLEADIMELMWQRDIASVREIHKALKMDRDIAYTTVMTVMSRLSNKGILQKERDGKHYLYKPAVSKEEFSQTMFSSMVGGFKADLGSQALSFFVESLTEDEETLGELERLIQEKRKRIKE